MRILLCSNNINHKELLEKSWSLKGHDSDLTIDLLGYAGIEIKTANLDKRTHQFSEAKDFLQPYFQKVISLVQEKGIIGNYDMIVAPHENLLIDYLGGLGEHIPLRPHKILEELKNDKINIIDALREYHIWYIKTGENQLHSLRVQEPCGIKVDSFSDTDLKKIEDTQSSIGVIDMDYSSIVQSEPDKVEDVHYTIGFHMFKNG